MSHRQPSDHTPRLTSTSASFHAQRVWQVKQSSTYDADAAYMRFWLPELRAVPKEFCHHPYNLDAAIRRKYNVPEEVRERRAYICLGKRC